MYKRFKLFFFIICFPSLIGFAFAQGLSNTDDEEPKPMTFELINEIGRAVPRNMLYNVALDQYMLVDAYQRLVLVDGQTFTTQFVIYESGNYSDFAFSNDGTLLAIALDSRIELWDTQTGQQIARLTELGPPQRIVAPITFSRDDTLLIFEGVYAAPRSIRTFEGQTITVPWVWHIPSARGINTSNFPQRAEAWQFFDYRNGLVIAPNNRLVAALPGRIQVLDSDTLDVLFDIPTDRYENDPMIVQFSARDDQIYFQPNDTNTIVQVDTERGVLAEIPLEEALTTSDLELLGGIQLSQQARQIGSSATSLGGIRNIFLPNRASERYGEGRLSLTLIDLIIPPISVGDNIRALIFIYNEDTQLGYFRLTSGGSQQIILNPDSSQLILRRSSGNNERVATYDLDTGRQLRSFIPSLRGIGGYSRIRKNRVLAFNTTGDVLISDFQRYDAETNAVIIEDLTYSRRFNDYFISANNSNIVTVSGSEWRVWDTENREVIRREVLPLSGSLIAVEPDGYRWLSRTQVIGAQVGVEIVDLHDDDIQVERVTFENIPGSSINNIYPNSTWTHFLVLYSNNIYGEYNPGNQLAIYSMDEGLLWHFAGDDLPPPNNRNYGWADEDTIFINGFGYIGEQPERVFNVEYHESGVPACIVDKFPEQLDEWRLLWENRIYYLRNDQLHNLALLICNENPQTVEQAEQLFVPTPTRLPVTVTPIIIPDIPVCVTIAYANRLDDYVTIWRDMVQGLDEEARAEMESIVCDGLGERDLPFFNPDNRLDQFNQTMFIDIATGDRSTGTFTPIERESRPTQPIVTAFIEQYDRNPGQLALSPDGSQIAVSNLPGELIVYRIIEGYDDIMADVTATAVAIQEARNWVYPQASPTPIFDPIGTARPTLTPTPLATPMPNPDLLQLEQSGRTESICPVEFLYTPDNLPEEWRPTGVIATQIQDDVLWRVNPITGARAPDETLPQCYEGINCSFSTDRQWILASTSSSVFVIRPDGTGSRGLWEADDFDDGLQDFPFARRPSLTWWDGNTLQWQTQEYDQDEQVWRNYINRDILGVTPDPDPILIEDIIINNILTQRVFDISASEWAVARIPFSTGTSLTYQYYLFNLQTKDWVMFAKRPSIQFGQDALGTRLFYSYSTTSRRIWNQIELDSVTTEGYVANELPVFSTGAWSLDGRYRIASTDNRAYPIQIWDSQTGLIRRYCIPETGTRFYDGGFLWSNDHRYVALRTPLPKDELEENVGAHLLILDIETGAIVDVTTGISTNMFWIAENYE